MNIGLCGIGGRMGRAVVQVLLERNHTLGAAFEDPRSPLIGRLAGDVAMQPDLAVTVAAVNDRDMSSLQGVIDFSSPAGTMNLLAAAKKNKTPIVIGTTGLSQKERDLIEKAAEDLPVVLSPNMSVGVNLLFKLTEMAARMLPPGYDVEIFEAHHRFKKDAPSGTAVRLMEAVKQGSATLADPREVHGRRGITGERGNDEIGVLAMRGGDIVGEHTVFFCGMGERLELTHRATSRDMLARGGVLAMEFAAAKGPGLYSMFDVLGFS